MADLADSWPVVYRTGRSEVPRPTLPILCSKPSLTRSSRSQVVVLGGAPGGHGGEGGLKVGEAAKQQRKLLVHA